MKEEYQIKLKRIDFGQIMDALEVRAEVWETTASFARGEEVDPEAVIEDDSSAAEADSIAADYRRIIAEIDRQMT